MKNRIAAFALTFAITMWSTCVGAFADDTAEGHGFGGADSPSVTIEAQSASNIASGVCGTCAWDIDANGVLTVHAGTLDKNYEEYDSDESLGDDFSKLDFYAFPWNKYAREITAARFLGTVHAQEKPLRPLRWLLYEDDLGGPFRA